MTAVSAIILGLLFGFQRPNRPCFRRLFASAADSADAVSFAGAEASSSTYHPLSSFRFAVASRTTQPPTTCSTLRCFPPRASALERGARLLQLSAPRCQPPSRTFSSGSGPLDSAAWLTAPWSSSLFEGARLVRLSAPSCQPPNCEADFLRPSCFSLGGARLVQPAASFVNQDSVRQLLRDESWSRIPNLQ